MLTEQSEEKIDSDVLTHFSIQMTLTSKRSGSPKRVNYIGCLLFTNWSTG